MRHDLPLLALVAALAGGCSPPRVDEAALADGLSQAIAAGVGAEVRLGELVRSDWSVVTLFGPYSRPESISSCVGAGTTLVPTQGIESRDDVVLLVFSFPDGSHESIAVSRRAADFCPESVGQQYEKVSARFLVRSPPDGSWGRLAPASGITRRCS